MARTEQEIRDAISTLEKLASNEPKAAAKFSDEISNEWPDGDFRRAWRIVDEMKKDPEPEETLTFRTRGGARVDLRQNPHWEWVCNGCTDGGKGEAAHGDILRFLQDVARTIEFQNARMKANRHAAECWSSES